MGAVVIAMILVRQAHAQVLMQITAQHVNPLVFLSKRLATSLGRVPFVTRHALIAKAQGQEIAQLVLQGLLLTLMPPWATCFVSLVPPLVQPANFLALTLKTGA